MRASRISALVMISLLPFELGACAQPDAVGSIALVDQRPSDEPAAAGKADFARGDYGLAERNFRMAAEANPSSINAWVGLAASYDHLHRFDLAERAYDRAIKLTGHTPEMLNNLGYHYLLKGDKKRARELLLAAAETEPGNSYIQGNLHLLENWSAGPDDSAGYHNLR